MTQHLRTGKGGSTWFTGCQLVHLKVQCNDREPRLGGKLVDELNGGTVTIEVNNRQEERVSSNVIGVLLGSEEPDRCHQECAQQILQKQVKTKTSGTS